MNLKIQYLLFTLFGSMAFISLGFIAWETFALTATSRKADWQWADLHRRLDSTLNIINNEIKYKAEMVKKYGELPQVECLVSQLNQVFMNLLVNATHAIEQRGTITVRTGTEV